MKGFAIRMKLRAERDLQSVVLDMNRNKRKMRNLERQQKSTSKYQNMTLLANYNGKLYGTDGQNGLSAQMQAASKAGNTELANSIFTQIQQAQNEYSMQQQYNQQYWEDYFEAQLQPLQDEEERLETEKSNAEQDRDYWNQVAQSYGQAVKEDIKNVVPNAQA